MSSTNNTNNINNNNQKGKDMDNGGEQIKEIIGGMVNMLPGLNNAFKRNENWEKLLIAWLISQGYNMDGFSMRHYDDNGMMQFKLKGHSVSKGRDKDQIYRKSKTELRQWAAHHNPSLLEGI